MSVGHRIVDKIEHVISYFWGLLVSCFDDYTLMTLVIFTVLLALCDTVLVALTAFFGAYFILRLVGHVSGAVTTNAQINAQANVQIAAALARFHPPEAQSVEESST